MTEKPTLDTKLALKAARLLSPIDLASGSATRIQLLKDCGVEFRSYPQDTDEDRGLATTPGQIVCHIAKGKMDAFASSADFDPARLALALDTMVSFHGRMLGKPHDEADARRMITAFCGQWQDIVTGYVLHIPGKGMRTGAAHSRLLFRSLSPEEVDSYIEGEEWKGVAGGYRLQLNGWRLVERIEGSWSNIVGIPLEELVGILEEKRDVIKT